jgi:hypothetical protein
MKPQLMTNGTPAPRALHEIADDIKANWPQPYFAAVPYLDAMSTMSGVDDAYGCDPGSEIVDYFLSNAATWRGDTARRIKAELKALIK